MFKFIRNICASKKATTIKETELAISAILEKVCERCERVEKHGVRGNTVAYVPVGKSDSDHVLKSVRNILEKSEIPAWTDVAIRVQNGNYRIQISAI